MFVVHWCPTVTVQFGIMKCNFVAECC